MPVAAGGADASDPPTWIAAIAAVCATWWVFILIVQLIGSTQIFRWYSTPPPPSVSARLPVDQAPHVTVIRPVKGLEYGLYDCLASTFRQDYPREKLTVYFCVSSVTDPAYPVLQQLLADFSSHDARILIEEEDPLESHLGPNPKIRNMSRAYREAKGDIVWIMDCNIWVAKGVAGRMVDKLCGQDGTPYKFVHQLPLVVDVGDGARGGRLEEAFMAGSHAKFYTAINTVAVAPCVVGKSNMFRRSHLNHLTSDSTYAPGIDYFSEYICEDHLIGDLLWKNTLPGEKLYNHGLVLGDFAIQPISQMAVTEYISRRVRWLRVRKWTVVLATVVEPGVECLLCSAYGAFALTTLPALYQTLGLPTTWAAFWVVWLCLVTVWATADSIVFRHLHQLASVERDEHTPGFAQPKRRPLVEWITAWAGRELLAPYIWIRAWMGSRVTWRSKEFRVGMDMKAHKVDIDYKSRQD